MNNFKLRIVKKENYKKIETKRNLVLCFHWNGIGFVLVWFWDSSWKSIVYFLI